MKGEAVSPWAEAMLTTRPQPFFRIPGRAAAVVWKAEVRLIARIAFHFSTGNSSMGATNWMPGCVHGRRAAAIVVQQRAMGMPVHLSVVDFRLAAAANPAHVSADLQFLYANLRAVDELRAVTAAARAGLAAGGDRV